MLRHGIIESARRSYANRQANRASCFHEKGSVLTGWPFFALTPSPAKPITVHHSPGQRPRSLSRPTLSHSRRRSNGRQGNNRWALQLKRTGWYSHTMPSQPAQHPNTSQREHRMNLQQIAAVAHSANRELQIIQGDPAVSPEWRDAPAWQQDSAIEGVQKAIDGATPRELHESWCAFKVADGWVFGAAKDADAKTHPCLVDYDELPADQRVKDALFSAIVTALTA